MKTAICEYRNNSTKACSCKEKCCWQDMKYASYDDEWGDYKICKRPNTTGRKAKNVDRCTHPEG